jgi:hypothetical protein
VELCLWGISLLELLGLAACSTKCDALFDSPGFGKKEENNYVLQYINESMRISDF